MPDPELIAAGAKLAAKVERAMQAEGTAAANHVRAAMSEGDIEALAAFRDHQLATLVAQVEDSPEGAQIRWQAALRTYDQHVTSRLAATINGVQK
ncbi:MULTISPECIES: hypothetical protein [unclassified Sphingobium]|uniref:hypothetical protein n=1 Tax=unclassified Sphingobium TaxID=2611147 RepID=UPI000D15ED70|nr:MULTISPECIES: hypothetical protein [unclassified Sphingobium]PSO12616.1 hypothetical protein C7E20_05775 [Sphingobium sp. AEW4]TWD09796.1 hypothetical protein FB595_104143 [Sphingobium sp. AEW010]TWD26467.1 hypothetical protein FB596_104143 [Sphingobium sp. AEW013]TWD27764.1 hypothetical protein FB594_105185 [Sphingobium sp. AEW001]